MGKSDQSVPDCDRAASSDARPAPLMARDNVTTSSASANSYPLFAMNRPFFNGH